MAQPFVPQELPLCDIDHARLIGLVGQANASLARYDGLLQGILNPSLLLSPLLTQEAVLSSKIEGTVATLDEVLEHEAGQEYDEEKRRDIKEIINYRQALRFAEEELTHRPVTLNLIKELHRILMSSVRGQDKNPGKFRQDQNWIGPLGCKIDAATYVPPVPLQVIDHMERWEGYLNYNEFDVLVQTAIAHAQFELIHPFRDGNGRIGRLLTPLFLYHKHALSKPMFYLSAYMEANRDIYIARLQGISQDNDWNSWVEFFLEAIIDQARVNSIKVKGILDLYEAMKKRFAEVTRSQFAIQALDAIFNRPIFSTRTFVDQTDIPTKQTALQILRLLREEGILHTLREASGRRPAILIFRELVNLAEGEDVV